MPTPNQVRQQRGMPILNGYVYSPITPLQVTPLYRDDHQVIDYSNLPEAMESVDEHYRRLLCNQSLPCVFRQLYVEVHIKLQDDIIEKRMRDLKDVLLESQAETVWER